SGVMRPTFDDLEKPFYDRGVVELVDFLWDYEKHCELKRIIKTCDTWYSLKKAMIKGIVEVEEKINKVWSIKQKDHESILSYTYRYETLVVLVKGIIKDYKELYWYIGGLCESYQWEVESMCPITYDEAKEWALELEAEINDDGMQGIEIGNTLVKANVEVKRVGIKKKNLKTCFEVKFEKFIEDMSPQKRKSVIVLSYAAMWKLYCVVVKNNNFL
ncbi:17441_t:CDS:2, partial [Racocetra fulgida]